MRRILIIGKNSYIGKNLKQFLEQPPQVGSKTEDEWQCLPVSAAWEQKEKNAMKQPSQAGSKPQEECLLTLNVQKKNSKKGISPEQDRIENKSEIPPQGDFLWQACSGNRQSDICQADSVSRQAGSENRQSDIYQADSVSGQAGSGNRQSDICQADSVSRQAGGGNRQSDICQVDSVSGKNGEWQALDFSAYDTVVVCSALVHKNEKKLGWQAYFQANTILPVQIAQKAKAAGVRHYIFLSSLAVYGRRQERIIAGQTPAPETYYGHSKYLAEQILLPMAEETFTVSIVRSPMVYGPKAKGSYRQLQRLAAVLPIFPKIANQKSVISLQNLCRFLQVVIMLRLGGIWHPQDSVYRSTTEMMQLAAGKRRLWLIPFPAAWNRWLTTKSKFWCKAFGNLTVEFMKK